MISILYPVRSVICFNFASSGPGLCVRAFSSKLCDDCESLDENFCCCGLRNFHCLIKLHRNAPLLTTPVRSESLNSLNNDSILVASSGNERNCSHTRLSISLELNLPISILDQYMVFHFHFLVNLEYWLLVVVELLPIQMMVMYLAVQFHQCLTSFFCLRRNDD